MTLEYYSSGRIKRTIDAVTGHVLEYLDEDWNGMGTAWTYSTDPNNEHDAVREAAGMFDMSPLKKVFLNGADALAVLDHATTRDINLIEPGACIA